MVKGLIRALVSSVVAIGTAIVVAIALTIVDLYLTGHGRPSINRQVIEWPRVGVVLGAGDIVLPAAAAIAWLAAWRAYGRQHS